jgi:hypothetical protein
MWALSRPEELVALVKLRVAAGQIKRQIPPDEHWGFAYSMLQKVSRSFALVIQQLGPDLGNAVSNPLPPHPPPSLPSFLPNHPHARIRLRHSGVWRLNLMRGIYAFVLKSSSQHFWWCACVA